MRSRDPYRELLLADLALVLEVAPARRVVAALERYWSERERAEASLGEALKHVAGLTRDDLLRIDREVERLVASSEGSSRLAILRRGGVDASIHRALTEGGGGPGREMIESGVGARVPLRPPEQRYESFAPIGVGGMGMVFLAYDTELDREIAFKVVQPGTVSEEVASPVGLTPTPADDPRARAFAERTARFLLEARVTSGLQHPGILPVYELGETSDGLPYYTMRYVRGARTLADSLREARTLEDRLALLGPFLRVCDTIRYAHSRGVIHRDLKPANIALGEFGEVIVLDWGLARVQGDPSPAHDSAPARPSARPAAPDLTAAACALGTPGYMSPEAAWGDGEVVDERSDVYSLGATLFEILTGAPPFTARDLAELRERLRLEDPPLASSVDPQTPRELSRICARALARRPEDRHPDVTEFAAQIQAWRERSEVDREIDLLVARAESAREAAEAAAGDSHAANPAHLDRVIALALRVRELRPDEPRAKELIRQCEQARARSIALRERRTRRRLLRRVAIAGLVVATLGMGTAAWMLEERRVEAERNRANADKLASFMLLDLHEGLEGVGRLDLLAPVAWMAKEYYENLPTEDVGDAELYKRSLALRNVGDVLKAQGELEGALEAFSDSLALRERRAASAEPVSPRHADVAEILFRVGGVRMALGQPERALALYVRGETIYRRLADAKPDDVDRLAELAQARLRAGWALADRGEADVALARHRRAVRDLRAVVARQPERSSRRAALATALARTGDLLIHRGEADEALALYDEALRERRLLASRDPNLVQPKLGLAATLRRVAHEWTNRGQATKARDLYEDALRVRRWLADRDPSNAEWRRALAVALSSYAGALRRTGDREGALEHHRDSIAILRRLWEENPESPDLAGLLASDLIAVGGLLRDHLDLEGAREHYLEAVGIRERLAERDPGSLRLRRQQASALQTYAELLRELDEHSGAVEKFDYRAAAEQVQKAIGIREKLIEDDPTQFEVHLELAQSRTLLADIRRALGDSDTAEAVYRSALADLKHLVEDKPDRLAAQEALADAHTSLGDLLSKCGRHEEAIRQLRLSLALKRRLAQAEPLVPERHWHVAYNERLLANHLARARPEEALEAYRVAAGSMTRACELNPAYEYLRERYVAEYRWYAVVTGRRRPETAEDYLSLAFDRWRVGRYAEAVRHFPRALEDAAIRTDLKRHPLYYAACAAALATRSASAEEAPRLRRQALAWLGEWIARRRARMARIEAEIGDDPEQAERLASARETFRSDLHLARSEDPNLEPIRGEPGFEDLFAEAR